MTEHNRLQGLSHWMTNFNIARKYDAPIRIVMPISQKLVMHDFTWFWQYLNTNWQFILKSVLATPCFYLFWSINIKVRTPLLFSEVLPLTDTNSALLSKRPCPVCTPTTTGLEGSFVRDLQSYGNVYITEGMRSANERPAIFGPKFIIEKCELICLVLSFFIWGHFKTHV
jgi:hypothetical protein